MRLIFKINYFKLFKQRNPEGFIALIFVLIISSIILVVAVSASLRSAQNLQLHYWQSQSALAYNLAQACLEDGFLNLKKSWQNYNYILRINGNSCTIDIKTNSGQATTTSLGQVDIYYQEIVVVLDRDFNIQKWEE